MTADIVAHCWHCGAELHAADLGREQTCLACGKPTRCCRNCRFYRPGRPNDCLEPMAEAVHDKQRANFCGWFEPDPERRPDQGPAAPDTLKQAAEDLFK
jgi:hypothetical protein